LSQIALAVILLWQSGRWYAAHHGQGMAGTAPEYQLLLLINAPIALVQVLLLRHVSGRWNDVLLVVLIGFFWFWVAANLACWSRRRAVLGFSNKTLRIAWDLVVVALGLFLGLIAVANEVVFTRYGFNSWRDVVGGILIPSVWLAWSVAFVLFFGSDLAKALGKNAT
jgi:hypothetical protein